MGWDGIDDGWLAARARDAWAVFFSEVPRKWILSEPSGPFGSTGANGKDGQRYGFWEEDSSGCGLTLGSARPSQSWHPSRNELSRAARGRVLVLKA